MFIDQEIVNKNLLSYMERHTYDNLKRHRLMETGVTTSYYLKNIMVEDLRNKYGFRNVMTDVVTNGKYVTIPNNEKLVRIPLNINLLDKNEVRNEQSLTTSYDRAIKNLRCLSLFVNGRKIRDHRLWMYLSTIAVDMFVSTDNFNPTLPNRLLVVEKDLSYRKYHRTTLENVMTKNISIPNLKDNKPLDKKHIMIYRYGLLIPSDKYNITSANGNVNIVFDNSLNMDNGLPNRLEIYINKHVSGRYTTFKQTDNGRFFFYVPETAEELKEGPVFLEMCEFYINGYRVPVKTVDISNNTPIIEARTFRLNNQVFECVENIADYCIYTPNVEVEIVIADRESTTTNICKYVDDYMYYKKFKTDEQMLENVNGENNTLLFPSWVNSYSPDFLQENTYKVTPKNFPEVSVKQHILNLITDNSNNFRNMLSQFGQEVETYTINNFQSSTDEYIDIVLDMNSEDENNISTRAVELFINKKKIPNNELQFISYWKNDILRLNRSLFNNNNLVELVKYRKINSSMKYVRWVVNNTNLPIYYNTDTFGNLNSVSDLILFKKQPYDAEGLYSIPYNDIDQFYSIVPKEAYSITQQYNGDGSSQICFSLSQDSGISIGDTLIIANKCFYNYRHIKIRDASVNDVNRHRIVLNQTFSNSEVLPYPISGYHTKVYYEGSLLIPGLDYIIYTPELVNSIMFSILIFIRSIKPNTNVEIIQTGISQKVFASYEVIPHTNEYGFIYFDDLDIPFSLDYMDLIVNDEILKSSDVVIYSDRLIRVKNKELPFYNIHLVTKLTDDYFKFKDYIDTHKANKSLFDTYIRQYCVERIFDKDETTIVNTPSIESIYVAAPNNIDDTNKTPNTKRIITLPERIGIFLNRLLSDFKSGRNMISKHFDSNTDRSLNYIEYALVKDPRSSDNEIIFDCNSDLGLDEDFNFNPNENYRPKGFVIGMFFDMIKNGFIKSLIDSNVTLKEILFPSRFIQTYQYGDDLQVIDSNEDVGSIDDIVMDSNTDYDGTVIDIPEEPEEEEIGEDIVITLPDLPDEEKPVKPFDPNAPIEVINFKDFDYSDGELYVIDANAVQIYTFI